MLDELALEVRRLIYESALERCAIPSKFELAASAGASPEDVESALAALADAHNIVLQPESDDVMMANPFSAVPTPFVVTIGSHNWFANCIWDAMGVAAMTACDAELNASCGCCGISMKLVIPVDCLAADERVAHFAIPAARWWDDIVFN